MSCYRPLPAYVDRGQAGAVPRVGYWSGEQGDKLELPCGHCVGCLQDRCRSWSIRCMHEAQLYDANSFVTLDYAPEHLPASLSLEYRDYQLFMKRLRKELRGVSAAPNGERPIRFFVAGEYGAQYGRPHWHALLFNCWFPDSIRYVNGTYRSSIAEKIWQKGHVVIGEVTPQSAAYVAGYTQNKVFGRVAAEEHYEDVVNVATGEVSRRRAEFCVPSRRPGLGAWWFEKFGGDLFPGDLAVDRQGREWKVPRYYWEKFQTEASGVCIEDIRERRYARARLKPLSESSAERRAVREELAEAKVSFFRSRSH